MAKRVGAGFYFLNVTQFLGAFNDNILKQVLMFGLLSGGVWSLYLGQGGQAWASICLCIPFILFSGFAGQFSDKYSKRRISVVTKWSEIPIALFAMVGLWFSYLPIVMFALFAIALQSTFFSPAKFGILPEIIPDNKLSRANGTMNMFTWFSIILGCALGGVVYDGYAADPTQGAAKRVARAVNLIESPCNVLIAASADKKNDKFVGELKQALAKRHTVNPVVQTNSNGVRSALQQADASEHPVNVIACTWAAAKWDSVAQSQVEVIKPVRMLWLPGIVLLIVGALGTIASHGISVVPAQNPKRKISFWIFEEYQKAWRTFGGTTVMTVLFAYAFFYMIAVGIGAMIVIDYKPILGISAAKASALMVILVIPMGIGDYAAGLASRGRIRPELINFGAIGAAAAFLALGLIPANFYLIATILALGGFMCGFVMVPLQTMIQHLAGDEQRGQLLGFWNCITFSGVVIGNVFYLGLRNLDVLKIDWLQTVSPTHVWILCSLLTILFQLFYFFRWRKPFAKAVEGIKG
ncbi:MAG: hypothetical protein P8K79_12830 [Mariniblastus sp.]|nr:hypothetical protein [Mariniblastus sp.]